jgi:HD-like signal output (HDOD) protein
MSDLPDVLAADASNFELPVLSAGARDVLRATAADEPDLRAVADAVGRDPAMAAHVLRLAGSAMYGARGGESVRSLAQAVLRLGARRVRELALLQISAMCVRQVYGFEELFALDRRVAVTRALFAAEIARAARLNVDTGFIAGLLADVGMRVLVQRAMGVISASEGRNAADEVAGDAARRDEIWQLCWSHHARVGAAVCRSWGLAPQLAHIVEAHHQEDVPPAIASYVAIVALAEACGALVDAADVEAAVLAESLAAHPATGTLGLYEAELCAVLSKRERILAAVAELT